MWQKGIYVMTRPEWLLFPILFWKTPLLCVLWFLLLVFVLFPPVFFASPVFHWFISPSLYTVLSFPLEFVWVLCYVGFLCALWHPVFACSPCVWTFCLFTWFLEFYLCFPMDLPPHSKFFFFFFLVLLFGKTNHRTVRPWRMFCVWVFSLVFLVNTWQFGTKFA